MERFALDDFRELLGVEADKLTTYGNLNQYAIKPALVEVNALSDFTVTVVPEKTGRRVIWRPDRLGRKGHLKAGRPLTLNCNAPVWAERRGSPGPLRTCCRRKLSSKKLHAQGHSLGVQSNNLFHLNKGRIVIGCSRRDH